MIQTGNRSQRGGLLVGALLLAAGTTAGLAPGHAAGTEIVVLANPCLNLRPGPDTTTRPLRCLPRGSRLALLESRDGWGRVRLPTNEEGWVALRLVGPAPAPDSAAPATAQAEAEAEAQAEAQRRSEEETRSRIAEMEQALTAAEALRQETLDQSAAQQKRITALLRSATEQLDAMAAEKAQTEADAQRRVGELEQALAAAEAERLEALAAADALGKEIAALRAEVEAERQETLAASATLQAEVESVQAEVEAERQEALAVSATLRAEVEALRTEATELRGTNQHLETERAELESAAAAAPAPAAAEAERQIEDLGRRLRAAEMFLAASETKRRELAAQLSSLGQEQEASAAAAAAAPGAPDPAPAAPLQVDLPDSADIMAMVNGWAEAWSRQRVDDYLSFYARAFEPPNGASRQAWEAQRRERLLAPSRINVGAALVDLRAVTPDRAEVEILQSYSSDRYSDVVVKSLELVVESGRWKIVRESSE